MEIPQRVTAIKDLCQFTFTDSVTTTMLQFKNICRNFKAAYSQAETIRIDDLFGFILLAAFPPKYSALRTLLTADIQENSQRLLVSYLESKIKTEEAAQRPKQSKAPHSALKIENQCEHGRVSSTKQINIKKLITNTYQNTAHSRKPKTGNSNTKPIPSPPFNQKQSLKQIMKLNLLSTPGHLAT